MTPEMVDIAEAVRLMVVAVATVSVTSQVALTIFIMVRTTVNEASI